jgi:TP901 family phage tail tape measure protein
VARTVSVKLLADVSQFTREVGGKAAGATKTLSGELDKASNAGKLDKVTKQASYLGLGLVGVAAAAVKMAADFDKQMSAVAAATHAPAGEINQLRQAALKAGKDTQFSATQAAQGITELSKAGVSTADILGGGLKGALDLAAAGQISVGDAAEVAATALTDFKLKGGQVPHVADLLAAGAGKAQGSVQDMGMALKQSGLVASQFGLSVEDSVGTLAAFANAGLIGSDAGTSFKQMLLSLANPTQKTRDTMEELGISAYDAQGKFIGVTALAGQLRDKLGGLTQAQRNAALAQIFGTDAIRAASVLYDQGAQGIQGWIDKTNDAGYAARTAQIQTNNLAGDLERLKGSLETLAIQSGSGANGGLRVLTKAANGLVDSFGRLPPMVGSSITVLAGLSGAALLVGVGWVKLRKSTSDILDQLRSVGTAGERTASGLEKVSRMAGKAAIAFAVYEAATAAIHAAQSDLNPQVEALASSLADFGRSGRIAGEGSRVLGGDLKDLKVGFSFLADGDNARRKAVKGIQTALEGLIPGLDGTNTSLTRTKERITAMDQALAQMVQGGQAGAAQEAFNRLAHVLAVNGVSMEEFRKQFPQYAAALQVANTASGKAAGAIKGVGEATKSYTTTAQAATAAIHGERDAFIELTQKLKAEIDPVFGLIEADKTLRTAKDKATAAIKKYGQNSIQAKEATRKLAEAALDLQGKTGALGSTFDGKMSPSLMRTLRAAGLTDTQIKILAGQFRGAKKDADKFAGNYAAHASAPGAKQAKTELDHAYTAANHFAGPYLAEVTVRGDQAAMIKLRALNIEQNALKRGVSISPSLARALAGDAQAAKQHGLFAEGGWTGPGSKWQPAGVVHADEFVVNKTSRRKVEATNPGMLDHINSTGELPPGYAGGGQVWPFPANASMARVPSHAQAMAVVSPPVPKGGHTDDFIVAAVHRAFPHLHWISKYRPGARTLSGNLSYHALHRAVDWPASHALAVWWNQHYMRQTKEFISPWNSLNIWNGRRHTYTGAVYRQHNFAGGNAHDHIAMAAGGTIREPIYGVGASGRTYSFGEGWRPERVVPQYLPDTAAGAGRNVTINLQFSGPVGSQYELRTWLTGAIDDLKRAGRL